MTLQWRVDGMDSDGVETLLSLLRDGEDTGIRVDRRGLCGVWWVTGGATVIDATMLGCYVDAEHAKAAAERRAGAHPPERNR